MASQSMRLPDFIRKLGIPEFARQFNVTERAAESYMRRKRWPRRDVALRIVENSCVGWSGIYGRYPGEPATNGSNGAARRRRAS